MLTRRAHVTFAIKSIDSDKRIVEGYTSTPAPDRGQDSLDPKGAQFSLPLPLLWQHNADEPIGQVIDAKVTKDGIWIKAQIEEGVDFIDRAWALIKRRLVAGFSVGWKPLEAPTVKGDIFYFPKWEWVETSAVTIPMNVQATISLVKSIDAQDLAAIGDPVASLAGVPAPRRAISLRKDTTPNVKTYTEQIAAFEAKRAASVARMDEISQKALGEDRGKDEKEKEEFDTLDSDISGIDSELVDLRKMDARNKAAAVAVAGKTPEQAKSAKDGKPVHVTVESRMPDGLEFAAMVLCKAHAFTEFQKGNLVSALEIAKHRYPDYTRMHQALAQKANVAAGSTTDTNFAASLLPSATTIEGEFLAWLRPKTLIDRFGTVQNGVSIPSLKRVPFNVKIQSQTSGASAAWTGEGKGKPVTRFNITDATLLFTKIAAISVITKELARFSRPGAEGIVRDELGRAVIERMDRDFVDPAKAAVAGVNPASITNGLTALSSAGTSAANVLTDIQALVAPFLLNGYDVSQLVLLMPNTLALTTSLMQNSLGQDSFRGMTTMGGSIAGIPVLASQYLASGASYGNMIVCLSAENIALADDGNVTVDASDQASIEMSDAPANESVTPTASAYMVSMYQTNSIALRAEREINWKKLRSTAVTYMDDVNWGSIGSPF